jgi:hypothetical protein
MLTELGIRIASDAITSEALIQEVEAAGQNTSTVIIDGLPYFHCSITVFSEELTVFIGYNNLQMMANLCDWYDCKEKWIYRTKHQGSNTLQGVWVNLLGATTPDLLQSTLPRDAIGGGLTARMILIYEQRKGQTIAFQGITAEEIELRKKLMHDLEQIMLLQGEFKVTEKFIEVWTDWYTTQDQHPPFEDDRFTGYIDRRPVHMLKLCMVLSASRSDSMVITDLDFQRAKTLLGRAEIKMRYAFTGIGKSRTAEVLVRVIQFLSVMREVRRSKLLEHFWHDADSITLQGILQTLEQMKCIRIGYDKNTSDPVIEFIKNPVEG